MTSGPPSARPSQAGPWMAVGLGAALLALHTWRYPVDVPLAAQLSPVDPGKLLAAGRSLLTLAAVNLAALGLARPLQGLLPRQGGPLLTLVVRLALGLALLAHAVLALAAARILRPPVLGLLLSVAVIPSLTGSGLRAGRAWVQARQRWQVAAVGGVALALALPALAAFAPSYGWDALTYHLALPQRFLEAGGLVVSPYSWFTVFPLQTEMLYTLALGLDGPALAKLLHLELGVLIVAALAALARPLGSAGVVAALALPLADPLFLWELTVAYNDLALALLTLLAAQATLEWACLPARRAALLRAVMFCALCAGTRYPGVAVSVALSGALALASWLPWRTRLVAMAALPAGALLGLLPWLARNWVATGSPLATGFLDPLFLKQIHAFAWSIGMGHGPLDLLAAPFNVTFRTTPGLYAQSFGYVLGVLPLLALLAALGQQRLRRDPAAGLLLRCVALLFLAWFVTIQEARYLLSTCILLAWLGAQALQALFDQAGRTTRVALLGLPLCALAVGQLRFWNSTGAVYRQALGDVPQVAARRGSAIEAVGDVLRQRLPAGARLLPVFESRSWHLRGVEHLPFHVNEGAPLWLALHRALGEGRVCSFLQQEAVTHVLVNRRFFARVAPAFVPGYGPEDYERDILRWEAFLAASARPWFELGGISVYVLAPATECREGG